MFREKRARRENVHDNMENHPYFRKNKLQSGQKEVPDKIKYDELGNELVWSGYQWIPKSQATILEFIAL